MLFFGLHVDIFLPSIQIRPLLKPALNQEQKKIDGKLMRNMLIIANVDSKLVSVIGHQIVGNM